MEEFRQAGFKDTLLMSLGAGFPQGSVLSRVPQECGFYSWVPHVAKMAAGSIRLTSTQVQVHLKKPADLMSLVLMGAHVQLWAAMMAGWSARFKSHLPPQRWRSRELYLKLQRLGGVGRALKGNGAPTEAVGVNSGLQNWQMPTSHPSHRHSSLSGRTEPPEHRGC